MIRKLNGDLITYINNRKICLSYLQDDIGILAINNRELGKCPYSYTKSAIQKLESEKQTKVYIQDDEILYKELNVGTLINYKV